MKAILILKTSRNNLPKIKYERYPIKLDEYKSVGAHWIALYVNSVNVTYFDSFGAEYIPKEIKKLIGKKIPIQIIEYKQMIQ